MLRYVIKALCVGMLICLVLTASSVCLAKSASMHGEHEWAPGEVIVKFEEEVEIHLEKDGGFIKTGVPLIDAINLKYKVETIEKIFKTVKKNPETKYIETPQGKIVKVPQLFNIYRLTFPEEADVQELVRIYSRIPYAEYAEPNYYAYMCLTPNDPSFSEQWGFIKIQAPAAWDIETGDTSVVIGILDTGIDTNHVDLTGNLWINADEIPNNSIDDDGNGYVDDVYGWNFVNNNNDVDDGAGHGSHCAGIVSAVTDNSIGVAGTSWESKIMAVKVLNNNGVGLYSNIAQGIYYAADNGVKVINMSLGGYAFSQMWKDALVYAYATSVPVGAAGNDAVVDSFYPACFDVVLGVAGTDSLDIKWDGSNFGDWIDLSSPGVGILSTIRDDGYSYFTGTSEAAPFVSGVAALVTSYKPTFSTGAIMNIITNNTDPIDSLNPGYAGMLGSGRLNAYKVLIGDSLPAFVVCSDTIDDSSGDNDGIPDAGETVNLVLVLQNNGTDATGVSTILHTDDIDITISDSTASFGDILSREKVANSGDVFTFSVSDTCLQHDVLFQLYVTANGGVYEDTIEFSISTQNSHNVSGIISSDTTWIKRTYILTGNILVDSGVTLTIEPGSEVRVNLGFIIRIDGELIAQADSTDPIIFTSNITTPSPGDWNGILFTDISVDAVFDSVGNYLSGSILEFCIIEYAGPGIELNSASPFIHECTVANNNSYAISYNNSDVIIKGNVLIYNKGGIFGQGGSSSITGNRITNNDGSWSVLGNAIEIRYYNGTISNNYIANNTNAMYTIWTCMSDTVLLLNNVLENNDGDAIYDSVCGFYTIRNCTIINNGGNGIQLDESDNTIIEFCTITNNGGDGIILNIVFGWNIEFCTVAKNGGNGISASYDGNIRFCTVTKNNAYGVTSYSVLGTNIDFCTIANNDSGGICGDFTSVHRSTIIDNSGHGMHGYVQTMNNNNMVLNTEYEVYSTNANDMDAINNWWGTTSTPIIDGLIYDFYDDLNLGIVNYLPILTSPSQTATPYLDSLTLYPEPVGVETLYVYLTFSKPMDTGIEPEVLFAIDDTLFDTLSAYQFTGAWTDAQHWDGWYYIDEMVFDTLYRIRVSEAQDDTGFVIPLDEKHTFLVYTAGSVARELYASPYWNRVELHWHPTGIPNLLGYNMYRSETSGGPYTQINTSVITDTLYTDYGVSGGTTYYYVYTILDNNFMESSYSSEATVYVPGIAEDIAKPTVFALYETHPNPCVKKASIRYALPHKTHICLNIYDVQGRLVKTLIDGIQEPGFYRAVWDGTDHSNKTVATGVYFYHFQTNEFNIIKKLLLLH